MTDQKWAALWQRDREDAFARAKAADPDLVQAIRQAIRQEVTRAIATGDLDAPMARRYGLRSGSGS